jgi:hypothetical protein
MSLLVPYSSKVAQKNKKINEELSCYINKLFGGSSQQGIHSGCQFGPFIVRIHPPPMQIAELSN